MVQRQDLNLHDLHIGQMKCHPRLPFPSTLHIARLFRAVNQALQILFSPKLHIAGMTITHSPLAFWTFGFTLCSHLLFNCLTHKGCLIFLSRIVPSAAKLTNGAKGDELNVHLRLNKQVCAHSGLYTSSLLYR